MSLSTYTFRESLNLKVDCHTMRGQRLVLAVCDCTAAAAGCPALAVPGPTQLRVTDRGAQAGQAGHVGQL